MDNVHKMDNPLSSSQRTGASSYGQSTGYNESYLIVASKCVIFTRTFEESLLRMAASESSSKKM